MTDTEALRWAIRIISNGPYIQTKPEVSVKTLMLERVLDAARCYLALKERDEAAVERAIKAMRDTAFWADDEVIEGRFNAFDWWDALARAVLAAITEEGE